MVVCFVLTVKFYVTSAPYLQRSCPSDYIRHIHQVFIIIFETSHTGLNMAPCSSNSFLPHPFALPFVSSLAFAACFLPPVLYPSSLISWAMLAVSISFCNLDFIGCHVFDSWFDIRFGHIYFQGQYLLYFSPFVCCIFLAIFIPLVVFVFNSFLGNIFLKPLPGFSLTRESYSLLD